MFRYNIPVNPIAMAFSAARSLVDSRNRRGFKGLKDFYRTDLALALSAIDSYLSLNDA